MFKPQTAKIILFVLTYVATYGVFFLSRCCILRGPGGERIVDVVPGGTELELQLRREVGQAADTHNNPHVESTVVYCAYTVNNANTN
jgi:hypothetical protein